MTAAASPQDREGLADRATVGSPDPAAALADTPVEGISSIEARLSTALDPVEAAHWLRLRGELLRQDEIVRSRRARRLFAQFQTFSAFGLSLGAFAMAIALTIANRQGTIGLLLFGVASYWLVPEGIGAIGFGSRVPAPATSLQTTQRSPEDPEPPRSPVNRTGLAHASLLLASVGALVAINWGERSPQLEASEQVLVFLCGLLAIATLARWHAVPAYLTEAKDESLDSLSQPDGRILQPSRDCEA